VQWYNNFVTSYVFLGRAEIKEERYILLRETLYNVLKTVYQTYFPYLASYYDQLKIFIEKWNTVFSSQMSNIKHQRIREANSLVDAAGMTTTLVE